MRRIISAVFTVVIMTAAFISERYGSDATDAGGPMEADVPVVMPANLTGMLISFGVKDLDGSVWAGEVTTSAGKIVDMEVSDGAPKKSSAKNGKFSVKSAF